jgi:ectoine hydroxylase-related dioxygenase (phytanoyl-CoA dioxygenase family)
MLRTIHLFFFLLYSVNSYPFIDSELPQNIKLPLTEAQLQSLHQNGYLILENVLEKDEIARLLKEAECIVATQDSDEAAVKSTKKAHGKAYYNIHNPFEYTDVFDYLIDHPKTFEVVTYLMGPYIQAMGCHIFVRCPCAHAVENNIGKFHTDSGPSLQRILPVPGNLLLQLKVQFFLTDMLGENESNFLAIPGSHVRSVNYHHPYCLIPECNKYLEQGIMPPEAIQLKVKAGDVLIHMLNLWHAVASNESENTRLSISIRYGQMWFRDQHFKTSKDILLPRMTPRQRRLIGDYGDNPPTDIGYRAPDDQVTLMLGDKAAAYGWPLDWLKEGDGKKYL